MASADKLWVGRFKATKALFVWDPSIQPDDEGFVLIYGVRSGRIRKEEREILKSVISRETDPDARKSAIEDYLKWKRRGESERDVREMRERCAQDQPKGLPKQHRSPHCFACKKQLDSSVERKCSICGGLICKCGACLCSYEGPPR